MVEEFIKKTAEKLQADLVRIRRTIHENPELGYEEFATAELIKKELDGLGLEVHENINGTGIIALLRGKKEGKTVLLRADMDALPVTEETGLPYASANKGKMHACGHDAHVTTLIGAAKILSGLKEELEGNVKFVFQPAEEGVNGAVGTIKAGVMENPKVDVVIANHVWPDIPAGKYGVRIGAVMAASDFYRLEIKGKGGHGAHPEKCIDPIFIGHEIYSAFQTIPSRFAGVLNPVVVSVTRFSSGTCNNVFPNDGVLEGTVRSYDEKLRPQIEKNMEDIIRSITSRYGASYEFHYRRGCPAVVNDEKTAAMAVNSLTKLYGSDVVVPTPYPAMTGEDFSLFMQDVPGVFFWTGVRDEEKGNCYPLHHAQFTINEDILYKTAAAMAQMAVDCCSSH